VPSSNSDNRAANQLPCTCPCSTLPCGGHWCVIYLTSSAWHSHSNYLIDHSDHALPPSQALLLLCTPAVPRSGATPYDCAWGGYSCCQSCHHRLRPTSGHRPRSNLHTCIGRWCTSRLHRTSRLSWSNMFNRHCSVFQHDGEQRNPEPQHCDRQ
jgi:hypothetical protein